MPEGRSDAPRDRGGSRRQPLVRRFGGADRPIDPTTHAIIETTVPTAGSGPNGITAGPDGNLWFTEQDGDKIGSINPVTRGITEIPLSAGSEPQGIMAGPDGNLWFAEVRAREAGVVTPTLRLVATAEPPASVAPTPRSA